MLRSSFTVATLFLAAMTATVQGAFVVPFNTETGGINTPIRNAARSYMMYYSPATMDAALSGSTTLTGLSMRMFAGPANPGANPWPTQTLTFPSYQITLGRPTSALNTDGEFLSTAPTFASYFNTPGTVVRSGPLTINPGTYVNNNLTTPNPYGSEITFSTPYTYTPGEGLLVYIQLTGYTPAGEPQPFVASGDFANGVVDAISSTVSNVAASPNNFSSPVLFQFTTQDTTAAPLPPTVFLGLLGVPALIRLRRMRG